MLNFTFPKFKILIIFKIYILKIIYLFSYFLFSIDPMRIKCLRANVSRLIRNFSIVRYPSVQWSHLALSILRTNFRNLDQQICATLLNKRLCFVN